jgi:hypothetical protein
MHGSGDAAVNTNCASQQLPSCYISDVVDGDLRNTLAVNHINAACVPECHDNSPEQGTNDISYRDGIKDLTLSGEVSAAIATALLHFSCFLESNSRGVYGKSNTIRKFLSTG